MPPNVLLIVADDMGCGDLGSSGNDAARTPVLDSFARNGLTLEHYSGSPVCSPARAALMTGRYPHRTGVIDTREVRGLSRLSLRETTLPQRFQRAGYATGLVGKWHLGSVGESYAPHNRGFDEFAGFLGGASDYWDYYLSHNGKAQRGDGTYLTDRLTSAAIDFVQRHHSKPFFLEVAYNAPHSPLQAPDAALALFEGAALSAEVKTIYAMISVMDAGIGRILQELDELRIANDTIVIFTSDNGPDMSGSPQFGGDPAPELIRFNAGLRGSKGLVFDGGLRVPTLVRWAGGIGQPGTTIRRPTHFVDWAPTLLEAIGVPRAQWHAHGEPTLDGTSFLSALSGAEVHGDRKLAWQWNRYAPVFRCNAALRREDWKLVWPPLRGALTALPEDSAADRKLDTPGPPPTLQKYSADVEREIAIPTRPLLFDLAHDPEETLDVSAEHSTLVSRMVDELDRWFAEVESERRSVVASGLCD